jgi:hypothetical protein
VGAGSVALVWALPFFGIIDLSVVPSGDREFYPFYLLETGWGLLFTILIPVPLVAWAVRPQPWNGPQVIAVAVAMLVTGLVALAPVQVFVALLVAASAAFPPMWRPRPRWSERGALVRPMCWPLDALVLVSVTAAAVYGWDMIDAARSGLPDDDTNGRMHLPMQAAFALALAASAVVATLALAQGGAGWGFAFAPAALSAVWFGVVSRAYPDHLGSLGKVGGAVAIGWGVALVLIAAATGPAVRRTAHSRGETDPEASP